ncbi:hypothetical protein MMC07_005699 [Pseudocyphellaria aurata]|nr:hypothetical protein [Pseudocyphellaria aurata]
MRMLLEGVLALVELKTPKSLKDDWQTSLAQAKAEYLAVHYDSPLPQADIDVPVVLTDMHTSHLLQQMLPDKKGKVMCTCIEDAAAAASHIKLMLAAQLRVTEARADIASQRAMIRSRGQDAHADGSTVVADDLGPSNPPPEDPVELEQAGQAGSEPAGARRARRSSTESPHPSSSKQPKIAQQADTHLDDLEMEALRQHSFRVAFTALQRPAHIMTTPEQPMDIDEALAVLDTLPPDLLLA